MSSPSTAERPHTYGEVRAWGDGTRWELIDGQAHAMTGPSWQHQSVVARLVVQLLAYFDTQSCRVLPAPLDVRLPKGDEPDDEIETVVQPDISVVCDLGKLDDRGCRGAPKLVIEVLSPSTAGRDHIVKRELYDRHGVEQYWLVHPVDRLVTIYRRTQGAGFAAPEIFEARGIVAVEGFAGLALDWDRVFADISPVE
ncbi:MAG: Uma2 family endonuclease [Myxococcales bacterium]|nr:Uma2 family endonuclease [Myxococcales bacterium]